jgi:hypothetical protein
VGLGGLGWVGRVLRVLRALEGIPRVCRVLGRVLLRVLGSAVLQNPIASVYTFPKSHGKRTYSTQPLPYMIPTGFNGYFHDVVKKSGV